MEPTAMSNFPVTIEGKVYAGRDELAEVMRDWGSARRRRHPGDVHPADRWNDAMSKDPAIAPAVAEAAASLLATSSDPGVVELVAHLSFPIASDELFQALLDRLEGKGPALPAGHGLRYGSLDAELHHRLSEWLPPGQTSLADRARTLLRNRPFPRAHVAFLAREGESVDELIEALRRTSDIEVEPYLAVLAIAQAVRNAPQRAVEIARVLSEIRTPPAVRELVGREIARTLPDWHGQFGGKFREALGLSRA
jgi:hypothetical protein